MVIRETSATRANRILNQPGVGEYLRPDGAYIDLTPIVEGSPTQTGCVALSNGDDALALFEITTDGVYQTHIAFAPTCRGRRAQDVAREMMQWMFERGARILWGDLPRWNRPVALFIRRMGCTFLPSSDADTLVWEARA